MSNYSPTTGFEENDDYSADPTPASPTSKPIPFGKIGSMLSNISRALGADEAPDPGAYARAGREQLAQFGQRVGFGRLPDMPNQASPVAIDPLHVTPPMSRPGEMAIRALAQLKNYI